MISTFLKMLEGGNDNALLRYSLGNAYCSGQNYQDALEHLQRAVEQDENYSAAWKLLGRCHYELAQYQAAVDVYDRGIAIADAKGDKQAAKEMQVFLRRSKKALDAVDKPDA